MLPLFARLEEGVGGVPLDRGFLAGREADTAFAGTARNRASKSSRVRLSTDMLGGCSCACCQSGEAVREEVPEGILYGYPR